MKDVEAIKMEGVFSRMWRLLYPGVVYYGVCYLVEVVYVSKLCIAGIQNGEVLEGQEMDFLYQLLLKAVENGLILQVISAAITLPILIWYYRGDRKRDRLLGRNKKYTSASWYLYLFIAVLGASACMAGNNLILASGLYNVSTAYEEISQTLYGKELLLEFLGLGVLIPIVEEFIFRGLVYRRVRENLPVPAAAVIAALMFAIYHGNLTQGIYAFSIGMLLAYVYERYHDLKAPILFHVSANCISVAATEFGFLDWTYETNRAFWSTTILYCILLIASVAAIEYLVHSWLIEEPGETDLPVSEASSETISEPKDPV